MQNGKKRQGNQHTALPKSAFRWLERSKRMSVPRATSLQFSHLQKQARIDYTIALALYVCPPEHCLACPRQAACTRTPHKGRSVSRMQHEELVDALRARMQTEEVKRLYKLRSRTEELSTMRTSRSTAACGGSTAAATSRDLEVGALVLVHNLLYVEEQRGASREGPANEEIAQTRCAA